MSLSNPVPPPATATVAQRSGAWAGGSDAPEKTVVRIGFIPLTDCAPVVVAAAQGFDRKHGLQIIPTREASWAAVRDKLVCGDLDASHLLYGLLYGLELGIGGPRKEMAVLMNLNQNGQAITLSNALRAAGVRDGATLQAHLAATSRKPALAHTYPTGTHALWLNYWLASHGIDPRTAVRSLTVPPPQMVAGLQAGRLDGYCAGEPWHAQAIAAGCGFTVETTQGIWPDHPEKVLGSTRAFVQRHPNTARAMVAALLEACRFIDAQASRASVAALLAGPAYVDCAPSLLAQRLEGQYDDGAGRIWQDPHRVRFHGEGAVNFPWLSDGMWFLTQQRRWGLLRDAPDYEGLARKVHQLDLYREAAAAVQVAVPNAEMRRSVFADGRVWDGSDAARYADSFAIGGGADGAERVRADHPAAGGADLRVGSAAPGTDRLNAGGAPAM